MSLATVTLVGNLTRDLELRIGATGTAYARGGIAVNRLNSKNEEETSFFDFTVFGKQAELASEKLRKGQRVILCGRLQQDSWETEQGEKRSRVRVVVDEIGLSYRFPPKASTNGEAVEDDAEAVDAVLASI